MKQFFFVKRLYRDMLVVNHYHDKTICDIDFIRGGILYLVATTLVKVLVTVGNTIRDSFKSA